MSTRQPTPLTWSGPVPVSPRFDDPYYSLQDGLAETRHVFLAGNDLPARLKPGFRIAELGFGTGLNALVTALAEQAGPVYFTSFEAFPLSARDMDQALSAFPELGDLRQALCAEWGPDGFDGPLGPLQLQVIIGDARKTLPRWTGMADAWYLDGFSPAKNPELWQPALMQAVFDHTADGGTAATYTAAGHVRRALEGAGFTVTRSAGFGRKRHMTQARK